MTTTAAVQPTAQRPRWWRLMCTIGTPALALLLSLPAPAPAQDDTSQLERRVKAVFLYKFVDYVAWPAGTFAQPDAPVVIGVMGDDRLAADLADVLAGRATSSRPLGVRRFHEGEPLGGMHILFVARGDNARLPGLARAAAGLPLLLVSESDGALERGSAINFVVAGGRVKFDIAVDVAETHGLKLSSRLLTVARKIRPAPAPG